MLAVETITKRFGGLVAVNAASLKVNAGSITGLIGPNGAGKSTLCDTIIGRVRASGGKVMFKGRDITRLAEHRIVRLGVCRKFQAPGVLAALSVADNMALAARRDRRWWRALGFGAPKAERARIDEVLEQVGLNHRRDALAGALSHGEKQWLEIGMVVATDADLLLLDEPTAGMGPAETRRTAQLIRSLAGRHAVIVIDHDMSFVEQLEAKVTVMHQGRLLKEGDVAAIRADPEVAAVYLGRAKTKGPGQ
jgi:urea transport system ATP-binding protein